ncbi:MAG TPA: hypothetical protein VMX17_14445 [Candidatus Glassbacteria bacterium]|nr:hypothetical protein [Candidatus Glassbacteria bacterium]
MKQPNVLFPKRSKNRKTGNIPTSHTEWITCPTACPLNNGRGCYGKVGPLAWHWDMFGREKKLTWKTFCKTVSSLKDGVIWRHNVVGDLPGVGNEINLEVLKLLVEANKGKRGFTYTHKPVLGHSFGDNRKAIKYCNDNGFAVSLSSVGLKQADRLFDLGIAPVVVVLPELFAKKEFITPKGRKGAICPAELDYINCKNCGICSFTNRELIIGFKAHGVQKNKVSALAG